MLSEAGRTLSFDEVTALLREQHKVQAVPTYANAGEWYCSCGKRNGPGTRLSYGQAQGNADRHLRAARKRLVESARGPSTPAPTIPAMPRR